MYLESFMKLLFILSICTALGAIPINRTVLFSSEQKVLDADQSELKALIQSLTSIKELKAHYKQKKIMNSLSRPLHSSGDFYYKSDSILIWHQRVPYDEKISIKADGKILITDDLGSVTEVESDGNRMSFILHTTLMGDVETLERLFEVFLYQENEFITLGLIPKRKAMKKGLESIAVACDSYGFIHKLILTSLHGETSITFTRDEQR